MSTRNPGPKSVGTELHRLMEHVDRVHVLGRISLIVAATVFFGLKPGALLEGLPPAWMFLVVGYAAGLLRWLARARLEDGGLWTIGLAQLMESSLLASIMMAAPGMIGFGYVFMLLLTLRTGLRYGQKFLMSGMLLSVIGLYLCMQHAKLFSAEPALTVGLLLGTFIIPLYMGRVCGALIEARDTAMDADVAKGRFLANMSHEFRTPLNSIQGMADLLSCCDMPPSAIPYVELIRNSARGLGENVQEILDFATIEAKRVRVIPTVFSVREIAAGVQAELHALAERKGLEYRLVIAENVPPLVYGDAVHARRALMSLVCNAIKFTEKGWVEVHVSFQHRGSDKHIICFRVRDTGPGFADDLGDKLFEPFVQADNSLSRRTGGTGLGLAIAKGFVDANNGDIGYKSTVGVGTEFWFTFEMRPVTDAERDQYYADPTPLLLEPTEVEPAEILVVDDQESNRAVFEAILTRAGHKVTCVTGGEEAIEHLTKNWTEIALIDLHMPGMTGLDLVRWIRDREKSRGASPTPVLVVTADSTESAYGQSMAEGATDILTKPVSMHDLLRRVEMFTRGLRAADLLVDRSMTGAYLTELRRTLGNDGAFLDFLDSGITDLEETMSKLDAVSKQGVGPELAVTAHSLKGVAGNLGLELMREIAGNLESQVVNNQVDRDVLGSEIAVLHSMADDGVREIRERFIVPLRAAA